MVDLRPVAGNLEDNCNCLIVPQDMDVLSEEVMSKDTGATLKGLPLAKSEPIWASEINDSNGLELWVKWEHII